MTEIESELEQEMRKRWFRYALRFESFWTPEEHSIVGYVHEAWHELKHSYAEPHRAYHTLAHVRSCLDMLDDVRHHCIDPVAVEGALWFHDLINGPVGPGHDDENEERSAERAVRRFSEFGCDDLTVCRIRDLIRNTGGRGPQFSDPDALLVRDIDWSILGSAPEVFAAYDAAIRREYQRVPEKRYRFERGEFCRDLLESKHVFQTPYFRARFEAQARRNLTKLMKKLGM